MTEIPIADQIKEVEREIALRRAVYPKFVASGRLKQAAADLQIARMEAALATLRREAIRCELPLGMGGPAP